MLTENFIAATHAVNKQSAHLSSALKDVGVFQYEVQPQSTFRQGFKKSSVYPNCLAISDSHIFAAQAEKAVINVYNREKGNHEATVPFPDRIHSILYVEHAAILMIGTEDGKLILWEVATGRTTSSAASHLQPISHLAIGSSSDLVLSGSEDNNVHVWSISRLVSFKRSTTVYGSESATNSPISTFPSHRAAITTLGCGHSAINTNIVISASADSTCYVWHLQSQAILRTLLLPSNSLCMTIDPADRSIYLGLENGSVQHFNLYGGTSEHSSSQFLQKATPIQLRSKDSWNPSSTNPSAVNCISLSYDGTTLLSGHDGGSVIKWDVAKHRVITELVNLGQPITNLSMLTPDGLSRDKPSLVVPAIVKPRLELSIDAEHSTIGLPPSYNAHVQVVQPSAKSCDTSRNDISAALSGDCFSDELLNGAIQAMMMSSTSNLGPTKKNNDNQDAKIAGYKVDQLQEELVREREKVKWYQENMKEQNEKHERRRRQREKLQEQMIGAYRSAQANGADGDAATKVYRQVQDLIDAESEDDALSQQPLAHSVLETHLTERKNGDVSSVTS